MTEHKAEHIKVQERESVFRHPLEYIAFWQFLSFVLLICMVWAIQSLDVVSAVFDVPADSAKWIDSCILTAGIIIVGFITVGHTYLQERRILRGLITVCSYCHKVELDGRNWQQMETFVSDRSLAEFTHGICPSCYEKAVRKLSKEEQDTPAT
jgi:hypothetical protein